MIEFVFCTKIGYGFIDSDDLLCLMLDAFPDSDALHPGYGITGTH